MISKTDKNQNLRKNQERTSMLSETDSLSDTNDAPTTRSILSTVIKIDFSYILNTWIGRVKLLELICVTLAGVILPSVIGVFFTRYSFFVFVVWTSFMYIFIDLILHITSLWKRLPSACTSSAILVFPVLIGALAFLIASSLIASSSDLLFGSRATRSGFSAGFGFCTMILFLVEAFLHYQNTKDKPGQHTASIQRRNSPGGIISFPVNRSGGDHPPPYDIETSSSHDKDIEARLDAKF